MINESIEGEETAASGKSKSPSVEPAPKIMMQNIGCEGNSNLFLVKAEHITMRDLIDVISTMTHIHAEEGPVDSIVTIEGMHSSGVRAVEIKPGVESLASVIHDQIVHALNCAHGNKREAANLLGISRRAFYRRLERHGLSSAIRRRR
jgi:DNA-binding NtrC family response regulator